MEEKLAATWSPGLATQAIKSSPEPTRQGITVEVVADAAVAKIGLSFRSLPPLPPAPLPVVAVGPGTWADKAGIQVGNEVIALNGRPCGNMTEAEFKRAMAEERPLRFTVSRPKQRDQKRVENMQKICYNLIMKERTLQEEVGTAKAEARANEEAAATARLEAEAATEALGEEREQRAEEREQNDSVGEELEPNSGGGRTIEFEVLRLADAGEQLSQASLVAAGDIQRASDQPQLHVQAGDVIMEVNGHQGPPEDLLWRIAERFADGGRLCLRLRRGPVPGSESPTAGGMMRGRLSTGGTSISMSNHGRTRASTALSFHLPDNDLESECAEPDDPEADEASENERRLYVRLREVIAELNQVRLSQERSAAQATEEEASAELAKVEVGELQSRCRHAEHQIEVAEGVRAALGTQALERTEELTCARRDLGEARQELEAAGRQVADNETCAGIRPLAGVLPHLVEAERAVAELARQLELVEGSFREREALLLEECRAHIGNPQGPPHELEEHQAQLLRTERELDDARKGLQERAAASAQAGLAVSLQREQHQRLQQAYGTLEMASSTLESRLHESQARWSAAAESLEEEVSSGRSAREAQEKESELARREAEDRLLEQFQFQECALYSDLERQLEDCKGARLGEAAVEAEELKAALGDLTQENEQKLATLSGDFEAKICQKQQELASAEAQREEAMAAEERLSEYVNAVKQQSRYRLMQLLTGASRQLTFNAWRLAARLAGFQRELVREKEEEKAKALLSLQRQQDRLLACSAVQVVTQRVSLTHDLVRLRAESAHDRAEDLQSATSKVEEATARQRSAQQRAAARFMQLAECQSVDRLFSAWRLDAQQAAAEKRLAEESDRHEGLVQARLAETRQGIQAKLAWSAQRFMQLAEGQSVDRLFTAWRFDAQQSSTEKRLAEESGQLEGLVEARQGLQEELTTSEERQRNTEHSWEYFREELREVSRGAAEQQQRASQLQDLQREECRETAARAATAQGLSSRLREELGEESQKASEEHAGARQLQEQLRAELEESAALLAEGHARAEALSQRSEDGQLRVESDLQRLQDMVRTCTEQAAKEEERQSQLRQQLREQCQEDLARTAFSEKLELSKVHEEAGAEVQAAEMARADLARFEAQQDRLREELEEAAARQLRDEGRLEQLSADMRRQVHKEAGTEVQECETAVADLARVEAQQGRLRQELEEAADLQLRDECHLEQLRVDLRNAATRAADRELREEGLASRLQESLAELEQQEELSGRARQELSEERGRAAEDQHTQEHQHKELREALTWREQSREFEEQLRREQQASERAQERRAKVDRRLDEGRAAAAGDAQAALGAAEAAYEAWLAALLAPNSAEDILPTTADQACKEADTANATAVSNFAEPALIRRQTPPGAELAANLAGEATSTSAAALGPPGAPAVSNAPIAAQAIAAAAMAMAEEVPDRDEDGDDFF